MATQFKKIIILVCSALIMPFITSVRLYSQEAPQQIENFKQEEMVHNKRTHTLKADAASAYKDSQGNIKQAVLKKVEVTFWDNNKPASLLTAQKARLDSEKNIFCEENVRLDSANGGKLFTEKLKWSYNSKTILSETATKICYDQSVICGRKVEAYPDLKKVYIYSLNAVIFSRGKKNEPDSQDR